jgi:hypothetical protein
MVERIASFLGDNALTRSWRESMDRYVISPVERMTISDADLQARVAMMVADRLPANGALGPEQIRAIEALKGGSFDVERANTLIAGSPSREDAMNRIASMANNVMTDDYSRERASHAAAALADGRTGLTDFGDDMRQLGVGSPVAAYSAVIGGGAMGTAAAIQAYDWWQSQQQQAQKERQLPLEEGIQL